MECELFTHSELWNEFTHTEDCVMISHSHIGLCHEFTIQKNMGFSQSEFGMFKPTEDCGIFTPIVDFGIFNHNEGCGICSNRVSKCLLAYSIL